MAKVLLILIPATAILMMLAQIDDDLSEGATELISRLETAENSESYLYLSGIFASEDENPIEVGKHILEENRRSEADDSHEFIEYEDSRKIPLPEGDDFCKAWEENCLEFLFSSEIDTEQLLTEHAVLVSRSNRFLEFEEYKTLTKPRLAEHLPPFQYITAAERIKVLDAISLYKNGGPEEAIDSLLVQFSHLRRSLELQDNLIGKLVFLMRLAEILDVASVILSRENLKVEAIAELTQAEKSFRFVAAREFGVSYHTFKDLDRHPGFFGTDTSFPGWITRIFYKPNMTINAVAPLYHRLERLSRLSPSEFSVEIDTAPKFAPTTSNLRNPAGEVLIAMSPNLDEYVARFMDFSAKLLIFNAKHSPDGALADVENPYSSGDPPKEEGGRICFDGPLEDTRNLRCLRVKI